MADYISRQEAIKAIMDLPNCPNGYSDTYDKACIIGQLEEVPRTVPSTGWNNWIPCEERLPEKDGHYLITVIFEGEPFVTADDYFVYGWDDWNDKVIAWAELPEPYQERRKKDDYT